MYKRYALFLFLILVSFFCFGQIQIVDYEDNSSIPFVHIITDDGKLLGTSNIEGFLDTSNFQKFVLDGNSVITIHHVSYSNLQIKFNSLLKEDTIILTPRKVLLPEVFVRKKKDEPVFLAIKGYYRSYQLENGIPKYFTDGIVVYYIPNKRNGILKNISLENRSFRNEDLLKKERNRKVSVNIGAAGIPYIDNKTAIENLHKKYSIIEESEQRYRIEKENVRVGIANYDSSRKLFEVNIDFIAPKNEKVKTILNYTSKILKTDITENYSSIGFWSIKKEELINRKEYRKIMFKHDKDKNFVEIDVIHEFYVIERQVVYKSDLKNIKMSNHFGLIRSTSYSDRYWEKLKNYDIPELSENIEKLLGKELIPYN